MPRTPPPTDPIAELVDRLERSVVATGRRRRELAREIEGDLREDAAARAAAGVPERDARLAVVAEFGDVGTVAAELSVELLRAQGRRFAALAGAGIVALLATWSVAMTALVGLGLRVRAEDGWMLQVSQALDVAGPLVAAAAAAGWLVMRRSGALPALATVAALQLGFAVALVGGTIALALGVAVPPEGAGVLVALVAVTLVLGCGMLAASSAVLLRWGAISLAPRRARS